MSVESHELTLTILNDREGEFGSSYQERLATEKKHKLVKSRAWLNVAEKAAKKYVGKFCESETKWWDVFSNADVLSCAAELAEYYTEHLKEVESDENEFLAQRCINCDEYQDDCMCSGGLAR